MKLLLDQKGYARTRRENTPTTFETINSVNNSTRYKRQKETKNILEYIHGGETCALYGAWDFLRRYASKELLETLFLSHKRGKFLETLDGKFSNALEKSEASMKKTIAIKYLFFHVKT